MPVLDDLWAYVGLAFSGFLAATLLPGGSEAILVAMLLSGQFDPTGLWFSASFGNVLGSWLTWAMGWLAAHWSHRVPRWGIGPQRLQRAKAWFMQYGVWVLALAWVPIIGDPLCLAAGFLRVHWGVFLIWVTVGKAARYALLVWFVL